MSDRHHNSPPLADRLELDHATLASEVAATLDGGEWIPGPIVSEEGVLTYSERAKTLKGMWSKVEKARKAEKDQILRDGKTVDAFFAKLGRPISDATQAIVGSINTWQTQKLAEERERQRKEAEAARIFEAEPVAPVVVKEAARVIAPSGHVAASASTVWVHRVTDPALVPRVYLQVSDAAIKAAIAGGVRAIPGVEITETIRTSIR